jgi:hypothetical protein
MLAIIFGMRRRESGRDEIDGVGTDGVDAFGLDVLAVIIVNLNRDRNLKFFRAVRTVEIWSVVLVLYIGAAVLCAMDTIANDNHMFSVVC